MDEESVREKARVALQAGKFPRLALEGSRTDLAKLVKRVHQRDLHIVVVSADAIARWQTDAPGAWEPVQDWRRTRGVRVIRG